MISMPDSMYDYRSQSQEAKQIAVCSCCGWGINIGDDYWVIENKIYCNECIDQFKKVGEE